MPNGLFLQQAGQGDAYILPGVDQSGLLNVLHDQKARAAAEQKRADQQRALRDKQLEEMMKWTPEQAWYPHQQQLDDSVQRVFEKQRDMAYNEDVSPQARYELAALRQRSESIAAKSNAIKKQYGDWNAQIKNADKYTDKNYLQSRLNDEVFGNDGNKDVDSVDFDSINNIVLGRDPNAFKVQEWAKDFAEGLPEYVDVNLGTYQTPTGEFVKNDQIKSKFFDLDQNGNVKYVNGKPVIKVNDETVGLALQEPRTAEWVSQQMSLPQNRYKTEKDIVTELLSPYATIQQKTSLSKGFKPESSGGSGKSDELEGITWSYDQPWKTTIGKGGTGIAEGHLPVEIRLGGKKLDKKMLVRSGHIYDENTNQPISDMDQVGDKEMKVTRIALVPKNTANGRYMVRSKAQQETDPNTTYEWVVFGQMIQKKGGREVTRNVMMPYKEVANDVDSAYQLNLYNRDLRQATPQEIAATINAYYGEDLSPEEKAQIFRKVLETGSIE